jgi:CheY-like chemotaxis protein
MVDDAKKILIIDDEIKNFKYLSLILEENGFSNVYSALNGIEGLQKVREIRPDLIILDIRMPRKSGIEVFNELKKTYAYKDIPIIVLTGEADFLKRLVELRGYRENEILQDMDAETALKHFISSSPNFFLEKPIEPDDFIDVVMKVLQ